MRIRNFKLFSILGISLVSAAFAENPFIQTYYSPDPAPVVYGDTLCVYTGNDEGGDFFTMHGWRVSCTTDMVNWTDMSTLILEAGDFNGSAKKNGDWASQCIRRNDKYYYYVTVESTRGGRAVNVAVADTKEGPFKDALNGKHLAGPNWDYIDPTVFIDDDDQAYLYWGNPKLYYCPLKENMIECQGDIKVSDMSTFNGKYTEGPWIHKRGKKYYMIYAASGIPESIDYSWSDSPTGPWEYKGVIMPSGEQGAAFTVHSGLVDFKGRSFFFYHNQRRLPNAGGYSRVSAVEEFTWGTDGTIPTIRMSDAGVTKPIKNLDPYERVEAETKTWVGGITVDKAGGYTIIKNVESEGKTVYLTNMSSGFYTKVSFVDMSDGADNIVLATRGNGGKMEIHTDSENGPLFATIDVPASSGWAENSYEITGTADGVQNLFFVMKQGNFDFDYWYLESSAQASPQVPFKDVAISIPGRIEAEDYDKPGVGRDNKSFYDADSKNQGGTYREDAVDIVGLECSDSLNTKDCKGYAIGYTEEGEWLEYSVNVIEDGKYNVVANLATGADSTAIQVLVDEKPIAEKTSITKTGNDWSVYKEVNVGSVDLTKGAHVVKFVMAASHVNVDWIDFVDPNGSTAMNKISLNNSFKNKSFEVFSATGKYIGRVEMVNGNIIESLNAQGYRPGIYMIRGLSGFAKVVNTAK